MMNKLFSNSFLVNFTRIFIGLLFLTSGMGKLTHGKFPGLMGPVWLEDELVKYGLGTYARFIAYSQVCSGTLLLFKRFSAIGAIMMLPMILNILAITISLQWRGTPYVVFVFLLMNIFILLTEWPRLKYLFADADDKILHVKIQRKNLKSDAVWILGFLLIMVSGFVYGSIPILTYVLFGLGCMVILLAGKIN